MTELIKPNKLAELLAARKKLQQASLQIVNGATVAASAESTIQQDSAILESSPHNPNAESRGMDGATITLNEDQLAFVSLASQGKSCILLGAAGTGKTTTMRAVATSIIQSPNTPILQGTAHKHLRDGTAGIIFCAYTRRATANIRKNLPLDIQGNAITIHKLLEYEPVYYTVMDENSGEEKTTMVFEPTRNILRPLPDTIRTIVIEESSMVSVELFKQLLAACQHPVQFIFLGDIQQLPPVFGSAILGFKMLELTTVELTKVYRQALESPIIRLAHRILSGVPIPPVEYDEWHVAGQLKLHPWKKKLHHEIAVTTVSKFLTNAYDSGAYNVETDAILCPFNKSFGTDEINKVIANHRARKLNIPTYEVIAGFNKLYFSVGDKVLYEKEDAYITSITPNPSYSGTFPQPESENLDYWGYCSMPHHAHDDPSEETVDFMLAQVATGESEDRVRQASHIIKLSRGAVSDSESTDSTEIIVNTAAGLNAMSLGYALTIHKSQGSEWNKVFLLLHESHATMIQRELLYTAVTRAKKELYVICEPEHFTKGILNQKIKGNTLAEKAEFFKGRLDINGGY